MYELCESTSAYVFDFEIYAAVPNLSNRPVDVVMRIAEPLLFEDIYRAFKWSPCFRRCLSHICELMDVKYTVPQRFLRHRWLSVLDSSEDTLRLFDSLVLSLPFQE